MKFLHCADLHLGCPGGGERMRAFTHMLAFCKSEKVEILLLAGDLFEAARADERTRRQVFSALAENPSLCVLIAAGNHDPIGPGGNYDGPLPENVYVFPREWSCAEIPAYGARVWGASFASDREPPFAPAARKRRLTPGLYDLGVLHGDLTSADSAYRPLRPERIAETNVQYLALGHIHARSEVRRAGRTLYAYSGCLQGLGFDEVGEKGAYLGEVGENGLSLSFVKLCGSMTLERTLNVTGCRSLTEAALLYDRTIGPLRGHRLLLTLTGSPSGFAVDAQALARLLADRAAKIRIEDETRPELDFSAAAREDTLRGAFVRQMQRRIDQAQADGGDARTELLALELGLSAFEGEVTGDAD